MILPALLLFAMLSPMCLDTLTFLLTICESI